MIRKATGQDLFAVTAIYEEIHTEEEQGRTSVGWIRGIYPTAHTAENALENNELFVEEDDGKIVGAAIINQKQVDFYEQYACSHNCHYLRMDTNARNKNARALYRKLGYSEIGIVPTVFNGIENVPLVLLEKYI